MRNEKQLYIIVEDYPYGNGEPFIEDELKELANNFETITVIISNPKSLHDKIFKYYVPSNVKIIVYSPINDLSSKLSALKYIFSSGILSEEFAIIKKNYKLPLSFALVRLLISYIVQGLKFSKFLDKLINRDNTQKNNIYFYSYWFTYYTYGIALLKQKYPSIKTISRIHGWDLYMSRHNPPYLPFRKFIISTLDRLFPISYDGKKYLQTILPDIDETKIKISYLGTLGHNNIAALEKEENPVINKKKLFIVSIAFISSIKRIELLAEAISLINDFEVVWHHIGGGGTDVEVISKKLLEKKQNVTYKFHGTFTKNEIYNFLGTHTIHVLVNTSISEGLPVSIMEGMSFGIPAIGPDIGGIREIIENNVNGFLMSTNPSVREVEDTLRKMFLLDELSYSSFRVNAFKTWNTKFNSLKNNKIFIENIYNIDKELYRICTRCIIDNIDYPEITFNDSGVCTICQRYDEVEDVYLMNKKDKDVKLKELLKEIKEAGKNNEYDSIIGLSGGVDSSYLAYQSKKMGLRSIIVHLDNGWNSELAVKNIENIVRKLGYDLYTYVLNWNEFRDLQLSFFRASVVDIEVLTDHAINAVLHDFALKNNIKYILSGENIVTEGRLPPSWGHLKNDLINIKDIHSKFGKTKIKTFPKLGSVKLFYYQRLRGIKTIPLLDYIDYNKNEAKQIIQNELEWRDYGGKHYESVFTRFYQSYILPNKFHIDKRKSHYSTLICSGQLTREHALQLMQLPVYDEHKLKDDKEFVIKKLGLTEAEFDEMMKQPIKKHTDYKSIVSYYNIFISIKKFIKKLSQ